MTNQLSFRLVVSGRLSGMDMMDYIKKIGDIHENINVHESWVIEDKDTLRDSLLALQPLSKACERLLVKLGESHE